MNSISERMKAPLADMVLDVSSSRMNEEAICDITTKWDPETKAPLADMVLDASSSRMNEEAICDIATKWRRRNTKHIKPYGGIAQLGEHLPCKQGVMSSNLIISTSERNLTDCTLKIIYWEQLIYVLILK